MHLLKQPIIERIYDTAWTINGEPVMGRTSGWRWYELGTEDAYVGHRVLVSMAYAVTRDTPMLWHMLATTDGTAPGTNVYRSPHTYKNYHFEQIVSTLPTIPTHQSAEIVVVTCYGFNFLPGYTVIDLPEGGMAAFQIHSSQIARLEIPMSKAIKVVKENNDPQEKLGMPRGMRWRAIVGEYTAPGT
jgi:hypothetical protein